MSILFVNTIWRDRENIAFLRLAQKWVTWTKVTGQSHSLISSESAVSSRHLKDHNHALLTVNSLSCQGLYLTQGTRHNLVLPTRIMASPLPDALQQL
ncbi:uncharacterized protein EV420DRAFT_1653313 [Desarmillaria tabescens]|uniref:Uncharacterized protein n=1 Tax=Armillaria tabescens TaxID=1929756 RepID=A0AA39MIN6_ARMTA|nr:uncharacterized protein EV420DRAFT_1653313 [Desarmillaria tabescens]KAK0435243.1 hypothetical protein EV420DRAFT_1653313 [Desarmillaria tabescens]